MIIDNIKEMNYDVDLMIKLVDKQLAKNRVSLFSIKNMQIEELISDYEYRKHTDLLEAEQYQLFKLKNLLLDLKDMAL